MKDATFVNVCSVVSPKIAAGRQGGRALIGIIRSYD